MSPCALFHSRIGQEHWMGLSMTDAFICVILLNNSLSQFVEYIFLANKSVYVILFSEEERFIDDDV